MIFYAGFRMIFYGLTPSLATILRIIGKTDCYTYSGVIFQFILLDFFAGAGLFWWGMGGAYIV